MKKYIRCILIILLLFGLIVLSGCNENKEIELNRNQVEELTSKYNADALIMITSYSSEYTYYYEYYVFYKKNIIIEHKLESTSPLSSSEYENGKPKEPKNTKIKYKVNKDLMNELKNIIDEVKDKGEHFGTTMNYKVVIDNQTYGIEDQKKIKEIFNKIKGNE